MPNTAVYDAKITDNLTPGTEARRYYGGGTEWRVVVDVENIGTPSVGYNRRRVTFTNGDALIVTSRTRWEVRKVLNLDPAHEGCRIDTETGDCIDRDCHR